MRVTERVRVRVSLNSKPNTNCHPNKKKAESAKLRSKNEWKNAKITPEKLLTGRKQRKVSSYFCFLLTTPHIGLILCASHSGAVVNNKMSFDSNLASSLPGNKI